MVHLKQSVGIRVVNWSPYKTGRTLAAARPSALQVSQGGLVT